MELISITTRPRGDIRVEFEIFLNRKIRYSNSLVGGSDKSTNTGCVKKSYQK